MSLTITLPRTLETELQSAADARDWSVEQLALYILAHALEANRTPSPEEVVAEIRAAPASAAPVSSGSLAEALQNASEDPDFELETWRHEWFRVEAEMKALSRANDVAEGRG
ncbi:MAG TPA: hypothetical protein VGG06_12195 [Thermoanaerobaculia bacterium]|jgi:ribosomal protein L12E/L44/L45/RPP1/RPP2